MGTGEGNNILSHATYNYVKVVDKDWTEPTEPEVTVTFEKQYADLLYSLADGTPSAMGDATVTLKEMSDNTISMSLAFSEMNVESTDLVKGTDDKGRTTYTGTANFQGTNFAVKALRYTKDEEEKLYMTLIPTEGTTLAFGEDPDYVAPAEPEDVTLWENYQADGTGFSKTATINWDKQKIVASIDFSNGGDDKDILAMTTGESFAAFQTSTYRTMHWYCQQSVKQMSGFFAKSGSANNNTGRMDVADCLAKFEISKAEGLKVNGEVKMTPEVLDELFASNTILIGSGESPKFSQAFYKYIKVVSLDWTETTEPETPKAVVYKNELTIVRGANHKVYNDAEVTVLAKGEGKYEVTLPEFADMDLTNSGTVGKIVFTANGEEVDGVLKLTAENAAGVISTGEGWKNYAADVTMSGEVENGQLAAKFTVVLGGMSDYTYELGFGKEIFIPTTETVTDWANIKFGDSDPVNIENAKLDITMVSMSTAMVTFKDVTINGNNIGDFAISGVQASLNPEDYTTILTTEATNGTWVRTVENNALGVFVGDESDIRNFEGSQDEEAGKTIVKFGVFFGSAYGWADIVFGEKVETPEPPVEDYAINFDKDAKQNHSSRYSTSVSLQQTGKDKQTVNVFASRAAYEDHTSSVFNVEAGSELTASFNYSGQWMNGYIYIDRDNDGEFSYKEGQWDQAGTDLVAYSFYTTLANPKVNDGNGYNSTGASVSGDDRSNVNPPSFTAPTEPGTYRIRFKIDWNCILPGGSSDILSDGGGVWDATLNVVAAKPTVKEEKSFTDAISMVANGVSEPVGQAQVTIKEMTDKTISMTLAIVGQESAEYTASGFTKTVDTEKNRTTYTGSLNVDGDDFDVTALVYTVDATEKLYMVAKGAEFNYVIGTNPDAPTVVSDKTYTSNLRIYDGEEPVVEETEAQVNVTMYSDDTYKITLKDVSMLNQTSDLVFVGKAIAEETDSEAPRTIMAKSDGATTNFFGEEMNATFEITEVSADEVKMGFSIESDNFSYLGEFNYEEEKPEPEVYTSNLHIYDAAAPETDLFKADKANVEFLATETGEFRLTLKDVTLNGQTADLEFAGMLPTPDAGGQEPLAEEGDAEAIKLKGFATGATAEFLGGSSATAEFSISYNAADEFMMTFTMKAGEKNYAGEFNYEAKTPATEPFCKENYVADGNGFEWEIPVDWDTQKIVMSIDPSTCTGSCEHVIGLGASPTTFHGNLQLYRTSADQMLQGYFENDGGNHNTGKFAETAPFLVEVSKAQGFVVNDEVKIAASEMSELFDLSTVKMGTGEGANDKSRATYNYVKVVDKDWTKDPATGINATTVAEGEFEVFSVDGVKLAKLQKGLNLVRSADGKVKKVLVK